VVTGLTAGSATFIFTNAGGCSDTTGIVTVNPLPEVSITGSNTICIGDTTQLMPASGGTWSSTNSAVATVTNAGLVTAVSAGTATFIFTANGTNCQATTGVVTVSAAPVLTISSNPVCLGSTVTLSASTSGSWMSNN